jgi:S-adenosylmethionine synthetase
VSISLNHHERSDWLLLRSIAEEALEEACSGLPLPDLELNGAGMFVCGGPNGDHGLSGQKLVVDAYGSGVPIGGGAWSGKDLFKVDRLGGVAARRLALEALVGSDAMTATVTLDYHPGGDRPASIALQLDGQPSETIPIPAEYGSLESDRLHGLFVKVDCSLVDLARWGHQQGGLPWELAAEPVNDPTTARGRLPSSTAQKARLAERRSRAPVAAPGLEAGLGDASGPLQRTRL